MNRRPAPDGARPSSTRTLAIITPPVLLASTYLAYNGFVGLFGFQIGYFLGFLFKWVFWCLFIPFWLVGSDGLRRMFRPIDPRVGRSSWVDWLLLALPVIVAYGYAFPRVLPYATVGIVLLSAVIALVNGTLEEVLWRGTYVQVFPGRSVSAGGGLPTARARFDGRSSRTSCWTSPGSARWSTSGSEAAVSPWDRSRRGRGTAIRSDLREDPPFSLA